MSVGVNQVTKATLAKKRQQKQIALVAILAIGLVIALLTQPGKTPPVPPPVAAAPPPPSPLPVASVAVVAEPKIEPNRSLVNQFSETRVLPRLGADAIERQSLFSPVAIEPASVAVTQPIQAVYGSSAGHVALVDRGIIRSGATIRDGRRVMQVTTDGVQVSVLKP